MPWQAGVLTVCVFGRPSQLHGDGERSAQDCAPDVAWHTVCFAVLVVRMDNRMTISRDSFYASLSSFVFLIAR